MFLDTPPMVVIQFRPSGVGWAGGTQSENMPLRGPTCEFARFQAEPKFPSWTECGNMLKKFEYGGWQLLDGWGLRIL